MGTNLSLVSHVCHLDDGNVIFRTISHYIVTWSTLITLAETCKHKHRKAQKTYDAKALAKAGFEYPCTHEGLDERKVDWPAGSGFHHIGVALLSILAFVKEGARCERTSLSAIYISFLYHIN